MIFFRVFLLGFALVLHEGFFGNWSLFFQVANGIFSSMFYLPIYLIIFNTYAICRIDDISWGTKDLNKSESRDKSIESTWKILKYIYVGKYIFWNLVFSTVFYLVGRSDISRAYLSFFLMVIPSLLLLVKCVLAVSYMCYYKFCAILDS